jgi:hypothetical protein
LVTSGVPTDHNVITTVLYKEDSDQDSAEYTTENVPEKPLVTYSQAQNAVQISINFSENSKRWTTVHLML